MTTDFNKKNKAPILETVLLVASIIMHYSGIIRFNFYSVSALLFIPLTVVTALFYSEVYAALFAFFAGVLADVYANSTVCFNTVIMTVLGFLLIIAAHYFVNRNVRSALCLSLIFAFIYFGTKWFIFEALGGVTGKMFLLLTVYTPSAIFTAVFSVPLYFARDALNKKLHTDI